MKIVQSLIVLVLKMFANDGIFVLFNAKVEVTARVAYIIRITRIAFKFIHNAFSCWFTSEGFVSVTFKSSKKKKKTQFQQKYMYFILHILLFYYISFYSNVV